MIMNEDGHQTVTDLMWQLGSSGNLNHVVKMVEAERKDWLKWRKKELEIEKEVR